LKIVKNNKKARQAKLEPLQEKEMKIIA